MSTTIIPYTTEAADAAARVAADTLLGRLEDALNAEHDEALALAREYADHLAGGGDPTWFPKPEDRDVHKHGLVRSAREAVFNVWNKSRDRRSVTYPWGQFMPYRWLVHEHLLDNLGEAVPLEQLRKIGSARAGFGSPNDVAGAAWALQVATRGAIRVRKTKVDGKVAWIARWPVDGDELADIAWREGIYGSTSLTEEVVAEALTRPFKHHTHEYPTE